MNCDDMTAVLAPGVVTAAFATVTAQLAIANRVRNFFIGVCLD